MTKIAAVLLLLAAASSSAGAFSPVAPSSSAFISSAARTSSSSRSFAIRNNDEESASFDPLGLSSSETTDPIAPFGSSSSLSLPALAVATVALSPLPAHAAGPDWGIFEGRTGSLLHPIAMGSMLLFSLSTAFLGFQWRRQRTLGDDISDLKKSMPSLGGASTIAEAIKAAEEEGAEGGVYQSRVAELKAAIPLEKEIQGLVAERKELSSQGNRDKHYGQGALLAFIGTAFAIEGPLNTYARAGKLFPGPHLYAGAGLVVLWSLAASQVPAMQKGSDTARSIHIGANVAGIGLFVWQVVTGLPILFKVVELTKWP